MPMDAFSSPSRCENSTTLPLRPKKQGVKLKTFASHLLMPELVVTMSVQLAEACELPNDMTKLLLDNVQDIVFKYLLKATLISFLQGTAWKVKPQNIAETHKLPNVNISSYFRFHP